MDPMKRVRSKKETQTNVSLDVYKEWKNYLSLNLYFKNRLISNFFPYLNFSL